MARAESNPTPSLLIWARETSGLSIVIASRKANVSAARLAAWESGELKPTFAQLRKLGVVYKRPLAAFYLEEPPKRFAAIQDFRRPPRRAERRNSPELTLEIRRAHDRREWALELFAQIEEHPPELNEPLALPEDPETAATEMRRILDVSLEQQQTWRADHEAFRRWRLLVERAGILTFQANDVEISEARGFSIGDRPLPVAVTNIKDAPRGRIFTLLHETTHILLRNGGICDLHESREDDRSRIEAFCNHVAGATLFPREALLQTPTIIQHRKGDIVWADAELMDLSRRFGGSREAALVRLLTLGLTSQSYYDEKRDEFVRRYATQRELERERGGFAPPHEVALTTAGPTFTSLVVENFNRERITASDVSDYLQIRLKYLGQVQRDYPRLGA